MEKETEQMTIKVIRTTAIMNCIVLAKKQMIIQAMMFQVQKQLNPLCWLQVRTRTFELYCKIQDVSVTMIHFVTQCTCH
jgi:hypothetical protein